MVGVADVVGWGVIVAHVACAGLLVRYGKPLKCSHRILYMVVSMGGSNELVECFCGGAVAEGGSGAVVQFVGDTVAVPLVDRSESAERHKAH